jgi:ketosteroid isomerase-like protein
MSAAENKEVVRRIYDALRAGDRSVFSASAHPDYVWRVTGRCRCSLRVEGRDATRTRLLEPLFSRFATTYRAYAVNLIAEDEHVVAEVRGDVETVAGKHYDTNNASSSGSGWKDHRGGRIR